MKCEKFQMRHTRIVARVSRPEKMRSSLRPRSSSTTAGATYRENVERTRRTSACSFRQRRTRTTQAMTAARNARLTRATAIRATFDLATVNPVR